MKKTFRFFALLIAITLLTFTFAACGDADSDWDLTPEKMEESAGLSSEVTSKSAASFGGYEQKLVRKAHYEAETKAYDTALSALREKIDACGGYVEEISERSYSEVGRRATLVARIPAEGLDAFLSEVEGCVRVTYRDVDSDDITLSYYDTASRLSTLQAEKTALDAMLAGASTTAEILEIHNRLYDVMEEIDALQIKMNIYENQIAYATLNLDLNEVVEYDADAESYGTRLKNAFLSGWDAFASFFTGLSVFLVRALPFLLLVAAIVTGIVFAVRAHNRRHPPVTQIQRPVFPAPDGQKPNDSQIHEEEQK